MKIHQFFPQSKTPFFEDLTRCFKPRRDQICVYCVIHSVCINLENGFVCCQLPFCLWCFEYLEDVVTQFILDVRTFILIFKASFVSSNLRIDAMVECGRSTTSFNLCNQRRYIVFVITIIVIIVITIFVQLLSTSSIREYSVEWESLCHCLRHYGFEHWSWTPPCIGEIPFVFLLTVLKQVFLGFRESPAHFFTVPLFSPLNNHCHHHHLVVHPYHHHHHPGPHHSHHHHHHPGPHHPHHHTHCHNHHLEHHVGWPGLALQVMQVMLVFVASPPSEQQIISMMLIWMLMMIMKLSNVCDKAMKDGKIDWWHNQNSSLCLSLCLYPVMTSDVVVFASKWCHTYDQDQK